MTEYYVLNTGRGIQSTTLHLMFVVEEIPQQLDCAIFTDAGAESEPLYRHLESLHTFAGPYTCTARSGNLAHDLPGSTQVLASLPAHAIDSPGAVCQLTRDYKLEAIIQRIRELMGLKGRQRFPFRQVSVILYLAVTYDQRRRAELIRRRLAEYPWLKPVFPLIERKMTLWHCRHWLREYGKLPLPVPRSGCTFCPFRTNKEWRWLRKHDPDAFERALDIDINLRHPDTDLNPPRFLHHSCVPLCEADLDAPESPAKRTGFNHECEGMCGL